MEPEIVFQKVGDGRGRPSKFVKEGDTLIPYKDWLSKNKPEGNGRGRKPYPRDENGNIIRPVKNEEPIKDSSIDFDKRILVSDTYISDVQVGGVSTTTINGTPITIHEANSNNMVTVWAGKLGREYKTILDAKDVVRPSNSNLSLVFAGEQVKEKEIV